MFDREQNRHKVHIDETIAMNQSLQRNISSR